MAHVELLPGVQLKNPLTTVHTEHIVCSSVVEYWQLEPGALHRFYF